MSSDPFPPGVRGNAIRTSTADDHGLTRWRLRADDVAHPYRGVSAVELDLASVRDLARAFLPVMETGQTFSHTTALALHGAPLPRLPLELHVSVAFPRTPPRRPAVVGHSLTDAPATLIDGMPAAPPVVAWAQSATLLSREDLVAVADHVVLTGAPVPHQALERLRFTAESWAGRPGAARLAWAVPRVRLGCAPAPRPTCGC
jgi:hypothetical protein